MIGLFSHSTTGTLSLLGLLAVLVAAQDARADDVTAPGCRAKSQGAAEMVSDCDEHTQEAEVKVPTPPPPTTPPDILYMKLPGEGGKNDHDRDRNGEGSRGRDASGRPR